MANGRKKWGEAGYHYHNVNLNRSIHWSNTIIIRSLQQQNYSENLSCYNNQNKPVTLGV